MEERIELVKFILSETVSRERPRWSKRGGEGAGTDEPTVAAVRH